MPRLSTLALIFILVLPGCTKPSKTVPPISYRSFKANGKRVGTITADGRYRNAYVGGGKVCAEPPPDIAADYDLERALSASLEAAVTYEALSVGTTNKGQSSESGTSEIAEVAEKTEALLVVRESLYRLCELTLNTNIDKETAVSIFRELLYTTRDLGRHDVLERLVETIETAVGFEDVTVEMLEDLTRLAAHIATIETYQSVLLTASSIPDDAARKFLLRELSNAFAEQLKVFPGDDRARLSTSTIEPQCDEGERCVLRSHQAAKLRSAISGLISGEKMTRENNGWKLAEVPLVFDSIGLKSGDVVVGIRSTSTTVDLGSADDFDALAAVLNPVLESNPDRLQIQVLRDGEAITVDLELRY